MKKKSNSGEKKKKEGRMTGEVFFLALHYSTKILKNRKYSSRNLRQGTAFDS